MKTAKEALATHLGMDYSDLSHYNYQPGRFTRAIYAVDDGYYVAVRHQSQLPKQTRKFGGDLKWKEVVDSHVNSKGWKIFKA